MANLDSVNRAENEVSDHPLRKFTKLHCSRYEPVDAATTRFITLMEATDAAIARAITSTAHTFGAGGLFAPVVESLHATTPDWVPENPVARTNYAVYRGVCDSLVPTVAHARIDTEILRNVFVDDLGRAGLSILVNVSGAMILRYMRVPFGAFAQVDEAGLGLEVNRYLDARTYTLYVHDVELHTNRKKDGAVGYTRCLGIRLSMAWIRALLECIEGDKRLVLSQEAASPIDDDALGVLHAVLLSGINVKGGLIFDTAKAMCGACRASKK